MKFKVGDKVRVIQNAEGIHLRDTTGEICEVRRIDKNDEFSLSYYLSNDYWYAEEDIRLVADCDVLMTKVMERNNKTYQEQLKELTEPLDLINHHKDICKKLNTLYADKNHDYGNSFGKTYEKYGDISALVRISDKMNRIEQLVESGEQKVTDEALEDSLLDMANYLMMWAMELEEEK